MACMSAWGARSFGAISCITWTQRARKLSQGSAGAMIRRQSLTWVSFRQVESWRNFLIGRRERWQTKASFRRRSKRGNLVAKNKETGSLNRKSRKKVLDGALHERSAFFSFERQQVEKSAGSAAPEKNSRPTSSLRWSSSSSSSRECVAHTTYNMHNMARNSFSKKLVLSEFEWVIGTYQPTFLPRMEESETHSVLLRLCVKEIERRVCDTIPMLLRLCAWKSWVCIRILDREREAVWVYLYIYVCWRIY